MINVRKTITATIAAVTLGTAVTAMTTTPAAAWGHGYGYGWGGPVAAGVIGGLALGAVAAGAAGGGYGYGGYGNGYGTCVSRAPAYDAYGYFIGYRRVRVAC